jgi:NarL family two-component system response regulator LiaR
MSMEPIRIILAEDHLLMRQGTRRILEQYPDLAVVGEAEDGEQALELVKRLQPDVAVLDIRLPKLNGIEVARQINSCCPHTRALMLTAYPDDDYILASMEAGASGYLLKTAQEKDLIESIHVVNSGESYLQPAIAAKVARLWAHREAEVRKGGEQLSPRELEVLELAAKGLRNRAIADQLAISVRTVEGHLNSIFDKLGVSSRTEAVLYALSRRLITLEEEDEE